MAKKNTPPIISCFIFYLATHRNWISVCGNCPKERGTSYPPTTVKVCPVLAQYSLASFSAKIFKAPIEEVGELSVRLIMYVSFPIGTTPVDDAQPVNAAMRAVSKAFFIFIFPVGKLACRVT